VSSVRSSVLRGSVFAAGIIVVALAIYWYRRPTPTQADLHPIANQNVLLITIDTLRADALGSYGGRAATPALDRLAGDGVRFDYAHAHAVVTLPSHTSILTGQYPFQHGIRDNSGYRLAANARTAATLLKRAGYATAAFVGAFPVHSRFGLNQGFDVYDDRFGETRAPTEFVMPERPASAVVPLAREWIAGRPGSGGSSLSRGSGGSGQPWFVWVHVFDPHAPYRPPPPFDAQYSGRPYDGEVAATDAALAPLLDQVRASGQPTLVVVTGDHGEALGDHGEETHGLFGYESTLRIPLIVAELGGQDQRKRDATTAEGSASPASAPSYVASAFRRTSSEVSSTPARHVDILPTMLEAVGQPVPSDLPGRSLLSASERRASSPRPSYFEAMSSMLNRGWAPLSGVISDRDKYIDLPIAERYELSTDAGESSNLAGRSPDRDRTLASALRAFGAALPGARAHEDPQATARLRSLGYVGGSAPIKTQYTQADDPKTLLAIDQAIHRGVELYVARRPAEAIRLYEDMIAQRPEMALAYRHLAFVQWESGAVPAAVATLRKAMTAGAAQPDVVTQLGTYLAESGNAAEAIRLLEPAAAVDAPDIDALNALGIGYARAGRADEARRVFQRILGLDAESVMAVENLGALDLARNDLASALQQFERAVALDPQSSQAHAGVGVVALKRGDRSAAIAAWKKAVELDATNYDALYNLATTLARDGRMAEARPYLERFVRTAPPAFYQKDILEVSAILARGGR
jgi:arylsulfatase A-like enzyme/Tfp pilus assembly protein PilF